MVICYLLDYWIQKYSECLFEMRRGDFYILVTMSDIMKFLLKTFHFDFATLHEVISFLLILLESFLLLFFNFSFQVEHLLFYSLVLSNHTFLNDSQPLYLSLSPHHVHLLILKVFDYSQCKKQTIEQSQPWLLG
jgi:hypothetical protein